MKRYLLIHSLLIATLSLSAQSSVFSFGARGGLDFMMPTSNPQFLFSTVGFAAVGDIGYTYYWLTPSGNWGIHTGLSAGYAKNGCKMGFGNMFVIHIDDYHYEYNGEGDAAVLLQRAYGEVPLMAAYQRNGLIARLGIKGQFAFWSRTTQNINNLPNIGTFSDPSGVPIGNVPIEIGNLIMEFQGGAPTFSLLAAMQIGYEAKIKYGDRIGVCAYLDFTFWNTGASTMTLLNYEYTASDPEYADYSNYGAFSSFITRINPIQIGISVYYAIDFKARRQFINSAKFWEDNPQK